MKTLRALVLLALIALCLIGCGGGGGGGGSSGDGNRETILLTVSPPARQQGDEWHYAGTATTTTQTGEATLTATCDSVVSGWDMDLGARLQSDIWMGTGLSATRWILDEYFTNYPPGGISVQGIATETRHVWSYQPNYMRFLGPLSVGQTFSRTCTISGGNLATFTFTWEVLDIQVVDVTAGRFEVYHIVENGLMGSKPARIEHWYSNTITGDVRWKFTIVEGDNTTEGVFSLTGYHVSAMD